LSRRDFNLVLHGHKHFAGCMRLGCELRGSGRTVLPIAAAGTALHPRPDDPRGHHFNLIEVYDDDTARLTSWFFSPSVTRTESTCEYDLDTIEDVRRRRYFIFRSRSSVTVGELCKTVEITLDGYSRVKEEFRHGSRLRPPATCEAYRPSPGICRSSV
jgi:hypothetical protein